MNVNPDNFVSLRVPEGKQALITFEHETGDMVYMASEDDFANLLKMRSTAQALSMLLKLSGNAELSKELDDVFRIDTGGEM